MAPFNRGGRGGGGRDGKRPGGGFGGSRFGGSRFGGGRDGERPQMHSATCSNCSKPCEVPFRPTGEKPVFCNDCFRNERRGESRGSERPSFDRPRFESKPAYQSRGGDSRSYGENSFHSEKKSEGGNSSTAQFRELKDQFTSLNAKLDKILKVLVPETTKNSSGTSVAPQAPHAPASMELKKAIKETSAGKSSKKVASKKVSSKKKK